MHNVDFSTFCPMFTLKEINHLEMKFLELIDYDVSISSRLDSRSKPKHPDLHPILVRAVGDSAVRDGHVGHGPEGWARRAWALRGGHGGHGP